MAEAAKKSEPVPAHPDAPKNGVVMGSGVKGVTIGGKAYKITKKITTPLLKHAVGQSVAIRFETAIYVGKEIKKPGETAKEKPADLATVIDLETGEEMTYILSAVVKGNLDDLYPGDAIIGHSFAIHKGDKVPGKRYNDFAVVEIEAA